ncbi:EF2563 family selenium-dependent molybdenum hydroxylase system protein [Pseudoflavonifractor sp. DSM 107456]|uniref:EF2563 family selenium-dependent molybdenum hydroxylase system protein n=1 Tax=Pseudoflavonifractor gallinarum TaxID=2779352 RepID=A0ABR9R6V9_9FIRM|nr:selenium-dependent molybdenum cofactor biosynthesis protein YqeB [Pseudoflavonifractor gallinarum]MBE5054417.1 EF2563 family selenium-dependent molybdenum hydroxylase system protein [Pseudoflavonifractor gallinarum]
MLVLIKGAGDLATGVAYRLYRAGYSIVMTDIEQPTAVRRTVAFCQCIYDGTATVEGVTSRRVETVEEVKACLERGEIPVLVDPEAAIRTQMPFDAEVDAILAKYNVNTRIDDAPIVLALGPGFTAGVDCRGVIETKRGHYLGRLILEGSAIPNTGVPGDVGGYTTQRIIRACRDGIFHPVAHIGDMVAEGDVVATVDGEPVYALMPGTVRGMLPDGLRVKQGMKSGDIDPRCECNHCFTISDKARAIGGGVLEGLLYFQNRKG